MREIDIAGHTERIADELGLGRFAVLGHSGGGPQAPACAALLGERVTAATQGVPAREWVAQVQASQSS